MRIDNIIDELRKGLDGTNVILIREGRNYIANVKNIRKLAENAGYTVQETTDSDAFAKFAFQKILAGANLIII